MTSKLESERTNLTARMTRELLLGHRGAVLWMTGLPGAGKSTLARALEQELLLRGVLCAVVDGDELRSGLSQDLGYDPAGRRENIRRATEVSLYLAEAGLVAIVALISPLRVDRAMAAERIRKRNVPFAKIFVNAPMSVCERRDPKGLYRKARAGNITSFTGIDAPYDTPVVPDCEIRTDVESFPQCLERLTSFSLSLAGKPVATADHAAKS